MRRAVYRSSFICRVHFLILCCIFILFVCYYNSKNTSSNLEVQNAVKHITYYMHPDTTDEQILLLTKQGYLHIDSRSLEFKVILKPSLFGNLPHLYNFENVNPEVHFKGHPNFFRSPPTLVIAIPTVKRSVKNYFEQTIVNLMKNLQGYEFHQVLFLIADFSNNESYTNKIINWLQSTYPEAVEHGLFEIVKPPNYYYPTNLNSIAPTFNDSSSRMYWRTKQNLDYAYLMTFARIAHVNSNFYLQLEDDVLATSGFVTQIINFANSKPNFFSYEFSGLGFIGKLLRISDLHYLTNSILMFYKDKPVDWIFSDLLSSRFCSPEVNCAKSLNGVYRFIQKPPLFQHVGKYSSLTNKVQLLREKSFQRGPTPRIENHLLNDYNVQITQIPNSTLPIDALTNFFKYGQPLQIDKPTNNLELNFNFDEPIQMKHLEVRFALKYNSEQPQIDFPLVVEAILLSNSTTTGIQKLNSTSRYFFNYEGAQQTLLSNLRLSATCRKFSGKKVNQLFKMILACNSSELNIEVCLLNGQTFRFAKVKTDETDEENPIIRGVAMDRVWQFQRLDDQQIEYQVLARFGEAAESEDEKVLRQYFQLDVNLLELYNEWSEKDTYFETQLAANRKNLTGIRVLQQDCFETFFAFICSSNNNVDRIKSMVNGLAELYGDQVDVELDGELQTFYNFPTLDQLYKNRKGMEDELKKRKFGYRAAWIVKAVKKLRELGGRDYLEELKTQSYDEASKELMAFTGIGKKVSDCILLMALDHQNVVPIDTHVFRISQNYLPKLPKEYGKCNATDFRNIQNKWAEIFGEKAGWAQTTLFTNELRAFQQKKPSRKRKS